MYVHITNTFQVHRHKLFLRDISLSTCFLYAILSHLTIGMLLICNSPYVRYLIHQCRHFPVSCNLSYQPTPVTYCILGKDIVSAKLSEPILLLTPLLLYSFPSSLYTINTTFPPPTSQVSPSTINNNSPNPTPSALPSPLSTTPHYTLPLIPTIIPSTPTLQSPTFLTPTPSTPSLFTTPPEPTPLPPRYSTRCTSSITVPRLQSPQDGYIAQTPSPSTILVHHSSTTAPVPMKPGLLR